MIDDGQHQRIARFQRYKTANYNHLAKCRKALENYRKNRTAGAASQVKLTITQNRLKNQVVQNAPEETWMDHASKMKEMAIGLMRSLR